MKKMHLIILIAMIIIVVIPITFFGILYSICGGPAIYQERGFLNLTENKEAAYSNLLKHFEATEDWHYDYLKNSSKDDLTYEEINIGNRKVMAWVFLSFAIDKDGNTYEHIAKCL